MTSQEIQNESISNGKKCAGKGRKRFRKMFFFFSLFLVLFAGSFSALGYKYGRFRGFFKLRKVIKKLDLTAEQKQKIKSIVQDARKDRAKRIAEFKKIKMSFIQLLEKKHPQKKELDVLLLQGTKKFQERALQKSKYIIQVHQLLTPKQRGLLVQLLKKNRHAKRWKKWKNKSPIDFLLR